MSATKSYRGVRVLCAGVLVATSLIPLARPAAASHVATVSVLPPIGISDLDVCTPYLVSTSGGSEPIGAVVDVEARGTVPVRFCRPEGGVNPVLIDPATGDLGPGPVEVDGTIGGEATTGAGTVLGEGQFTFGIKSSLAGSFDIIVFIEEPGVGNDDADPLEPQDTASQFFTLGGGGGNGIEIPGATALVNALDCGPEDDIDPSGSEHAFMCRATGAAGAPIAGAEVSFDVTLGPNNEEIGTKPCGLTDFNGVVLCSYRDDEGAASPPGTDTIAGFTGSNLESSLHQDEIRVTFAGAAGAEASKVASKVTIKGRFKGRVRSAVRNCKSGRKVVVKKVRRGRDPAVGKDRASRKGAWRIPKRRAKGRFYAVAKKRRYTSGGTTIVCKTARSRKVRRR